eukprot:5341940-Pyramimonas_sp.AAC.1
MEALGVGFTVCGCLPPPPPLPPRWRRKVRPNGPPTVTLDFLGRHRAAVFRPFGASVGRCRDHLGGSSVHQGPNRVPMGSPRAVSWETLRVVALGGLLGPSRGPRGALLGPHWGSRRAPRGPREGSEMPHQEESQEGPRRLPRGPKRLPSGPQDGPQ